MTKQISDKKNKKYIKQSKIQNTYHNKHNINDKNNKHNKHNTNHKHKEPQILQNDTNINKHRNKKKHNINSTVVNIIRSDLHNLQNQTQLHNSIQQHHHYKEQIPKRIRELVWITYNGEVFTHKCFVLWCENNINVFNFQTGHDIPESKGGTIDINNLKPICSSCNLSMGNKYTITEWSKLVIVKDTNET